MWGNNISLPEYPLCKFEVGLDCKVRYNYIESTGFYGFRIKLATPVFSQTPLQTVN